MTSPTSATNKQTSNNFWTSMAPYVVPPIAASAAIVPVFRDLVAKSDLQKGKPVLPMTCVESIKGGIKMAPTVGAIIGTQMVFQRVVEKALTGSFGSESLLSTLSSSMVVGIASAPILAVFNGQTIRQSMKESLRKFSLKQGMAIAVQETAFVVGLSAADKLSKIMKGQFGDNKAVDYIAAFIAGAAGSLTGHPANTALTRWQSHMTIDSFQQLMCGGARKARAIGCFSVGYKFAKETLNPPSAE